MKKRILSLLLVFCMVLSLLPTAALAAGESDAGAAAEPASPFTDVKADDWFYKAVRYVKTNGIFNGVDAKNFAPDGTMTRAMFVTVLGRMAGIDPADYAGETGFADVPQNAWYAPYVKWAAQFGITGGTGDGLFSPDAEIDRAQMAVFFVRYFEAFGVKYETDANITTVPADLSSVPEYAKEAVLKLWAQGLLNGDGVNFDPCGNATRAQVATLCTRVDESVETWYSEPGVPSERERIDPDEATAQQPAQDKTPTGGTSSGSSSSGGSSGGGTSTTTYYEVKFALGSGQADISLPETKTVTKGTAVSSLPTPSKAGVIFLGWYYDKDLTQSAASSDTIDKNLTLYAKTAAGEEVQSVETPNYITKTDVAAGKYTFKVTGATREDDIKFIHVTGGNIDVDFTLGGDGTVTATLEAGQTYQVELLSDSVTFPGENKAVRYLNILTAKTTVTNANLNENVEKVSLSSIGGLDENAFNGLFIMDETNTVAENTTTGTFTYSGDLSIGDTVAITSGGADLNDPTSTEGDVAYLKITGKSGDSEPYTYTYEMAEVEDVLFMPDVLPIESGWDTDTTDGNVLTITAANLATAMGNVDAASLDEGDFLGFLSSGETYSTASSAASYGEITGYEISGEYYIITYKSADEAAIEDSLDVYYTQEQQVTLTEAEITQIENEIKSDVESSGYAEQAAAYIAAVMLESDNLSTVPDMAAVEARMGEIEPYLVVNSTSVQMAGGDKKVSVEFDSSNINVKLGTNSRLDHLKGNGFNVEIEIPFTVKIGDNIEIAIKASFEEEIILKQKISTSRHKLGFLKYDYSLNASFEVGNYTGIGFTADVKSGSDGDDESLTARLDAIMERIEDYHEAGSVSGTDGTMDSLAEIYAEVMENANDTWIDIVEVKLFETNGNAFLHIFCWQIKGTFVVSANLAVSLGMKFDYTTQKQYNFSVRVKSRTSTNETIDIITPNYNFDFYVVGTIGIRAGIRLEMYVGLFSLKLDKIGITAEAGAYARLWGYFFYHLNWTQGAGKTENSAGAMLIEIGMYLDIKFVAQLLSSDRLTWNPTIYAHEWPLWSAGERQNVYAFAESIAGSDSYTLAAVTTLKLPTSTFNMLYMDLKSGEKGAANKDDATESNFVISFSNSKFSYDPATNTVTVGNSANAGGEETDMTITWKKAALSFTSKPIQKTLHISWSDPDEVRYINFDSNGGSAVAQLTGNPGQEITLTKAQSPTKQGYTFAGWYTDDETFNHKVTSVTLPSADSGSKGMTLYAKWTPGTADYTVEHYLEQLSGGYELTETETGETARKGTTNEPTNATAKTYTGYTAQTIEKQTVNADGSTVVKIYYDLESYKLTFKANDGTTDSIVKTVKHGGTPVYPYFCRTGYTFTGWSTTADGTGEDLPKAVTGKATYYAQWEGVENTVIFDTQSGTKIDSQKVKTGDKVAKPETDPTLDGYSFGGWYKNTMEPWNFDTDTVTGATIIYAKWTPNTYTVTYDVNGGDALTEAEREQSIVFGRNYAPPTPTRGGYTFLGWWTTKDGDGTKITAGTSYKFTEDTTVYARWTASTKTPYTVEHRQQNLDNDGYTLTDTDNLTGTTDAQTAAVAKSYEGFTEQQFDQKAITADGSTVVKIYYDRNKYTITWDKGEGDELTGTYTTGEVKYGMTITAPDDPTKAETDTHTYTFDGWYTDATGGTKVETFGTVTGPVTYYARFTATAKEYDITYNLNGGTNHADNTASYTCGVGLTLSAPSRTGYKFDGWYTDSTFSEGSKITAISGDSYGEVTLTAKWTAKQYTVTLDVGNGTLPEGSSDKISVTFDAAYTLPEPTPPAYKQFNGWYYLNNDRKTFVDSNSNWDIPTDNLVLHAEYGEITYKLTYHNVNGATNNNPTSNTYGNGLTLIALEKEGYTFDGWYTAETDGTKVTEISAEQQTDINLYAKWTANTYTVTFEVTDGTLSGENTMNVTYDSAYGTLPTPTPSDSAYMFDGWYTGQTGGTKVESTTIVATAENHTLYAQWKLNVETYDCVKIKGAAIQVSNKDKKVVGYDGITYDAENKTLTLNGATISCDSSVNTLWMSTGHTICLIGENTISNSYSGDACGICADAGTITFTGSGTLTVNASTSNADNYASIAIDAVGFNSGVIINGPTVYAYAEEGTSSYGVRVSFDGGLGSYTGVSVTSGDLTAKGKGCAVKAQWIMGEGESTIQINCAKSYDGTNATQRPSSELDYDTLMGYQYISTK